MPFKSSVKTHGPGLPSVCVALGLITALITAFYNPLRHGRFISCLPSVRLKFSTWLAIGLEFQLGADIVVTIVNPSLQALGELAAEAGLVEEMRELMAAPEGGLKNLELSY
jgi:uncharacterized membrane protein